MAANEIHGKRILITGGTGFIGSHLIQKYSAENKITIFDNGRRNAFKFLPKSTKKNVKVIKGDIRDFKKVKKVCENQEIVLHLAAIAGASSYEKDPLLTLSVNLLGTVNLLESLKESKVSQIIIFSTSEVYGKLAKNVSESDPTPIGPVFEGRWSYSVSKVAADHLSFAYYKKYNLPVTIVRPFNVYGPFQVGEGAVSKMIMDSLNHKKITVTGKGDQKRAWCYVSDIVEAVDLILRKKIKGECFNIGNPKEYSTIITLAKQIQKLNPDTKLEFTKAREVEVIDRIPSISRANKVLNFKPQISLKDGLQQSFNWYSENLKEVDIK